MRKKWGLSQSLVTGSPVLAQRTLPSQYRREQWFAIHVVPNGPGCLQHDLRFAAADTPRKKLFPPRYSENVSHPIMVH
jgi:hypothetical protein